MDKYIGFDIDSKKIVACVVERGKTQDFPDFTRGAWKTREPLGIVEL